MDSRAIRSTCAGRALLNGIAQRQGFGTGGHSEAVANSVDPLFDWQKKAGLRESRFGAAPAQPITTNGARSSFHPSDYMMGDSRYNAKDSRYWDSSRERTFADDRCSCNTRTTPTTATARCRCSPIFDGEGSATGFVEQWTNGRAFSASETRRPLISMDGSPPTVTLGVHELPSCREQAPALHSQRVGFSRSRRIHADREVARGACTSSPAW